MPEKSQESKRGKYSIHSTAGKAEVYASKLVVWRPKLCATISVSDAIHEKLRGRKRSEMQKSRKQLQSFWAER